MRKTFTTLHRLLALSEADNMPEVDFSSGPVDEPPLDDFSPDTTLEPLEAEPTPDVPTGPLTGIGAAILALVHKNSDAAGTSNDMIDYHANARAAIKGLIRQGLVSVENGLYHLSDRGRSVMATHGLTSSPDAGAELTQVGQAAWRRYFT